MLKANPNLFGTGKIHLSRADSDTIRFNTIEYNNRGNLAYIKFLVHYEGGDHTLTREVLKLNSDLSSEFSGLVSIKNDAANGYGSLEIGGAAGGLID